MTTRRQRRSSHTTSLVQPTAPPRWLSMLGYAGMVLLVLLCTVPYHTGTNDTWTQILSGQVFWTQGFPRLDLFSYTASDHPWVEHEWLACVVFFLVWTTAGVPGLVVWKTMVVVLTYWFLSKTARVLGARLSLLVLTWPVLVCIVTWRVAERPSLYTSLFLSIYGYLFARLRQNQLGHRWLWLIPGLHLLWVNIQGGWVNGIGLLLCWVLGETGHWLRTQDSETTRIPPLPTRTLVHLGALLVVRNNRIAAPPAGGFADRPHGLQSKAPLDNKAPSSDNSSA